jgi:hypothetical protein
LDEKFWVFGVHFDVKNIDVSENFKEQSFAFHDRLGGFWANIAQAKNSRSVGNNGDKVAFGGVFVNVGFVFGNAQAGLGHAW